MWLILKKEKEKSVALKVAEILLRDADNVTAKKRVKEI